MRVNRHVLKLFRWARTLIAHFIIEIKAYHCFSMSWSWAMLRFVEYTFWQVKVVCIVSEVFTSIPKIYSFSKIMANSNAIDFSNDILQPLEEADLLRYRDTCAKHLPSALNAHHFVTLQNRWKQILSQPENVALSENISSKWVCKFYVSHNRNIENCTFIEISGESSTNSGDAWNIIFPFTLHIWVATNWLTWLGTNRLANGTDDWNIFGRSVANRWHTARAKENKWLDWLECNTSKCCIVKRSCLSIRCWVRGFGFGRHFSSANFDYIQHSISDDMYFDQFGEHHATAIDDTSQFRDSFSCSYIRSLIQLNGGLGLFEKSTKRILAWILINGYCVFRWESEEIKVIMCVFYMNLWQIPGNEWFHRQEKENWPKFSSKSMPSDSLRPNNLILLLISVNTTPFRWNCSKASDSKQCPSIRGFNWRSIEFWSDYVCSFLFWIKNVIKDDKIAKY